MVLERPDASVRLLVWLYFAWHGFWLKVALGCRHLLLMMFGGQPLSEGARTKPWMVDSHASGWDIQLHKTTHMVQTKP